MLLFSVVLAGALVIVGGIGYRADWWGDPPRMSSWIEPSGAAGGASPGGGTPAAPGARVDAQGRRLFTVLGAGDVLVHPEVSQQAKRDASTTGQAGGYDFFPMFERVAPAIGAADLAICHLETPLGPAAGPFQGYPRFSAPPQVVDGLKRAGFDACSTASNHTMDQGAQGVTRTLEALDKAGLGHAGSARNAPEANAPRIYEKAGVKVGHLSYTLNFNGLERPPGKLWMANLIEPQKILAAAKRLRAAGAEIVVLSLHWGTEYRHLPDADQLDWVKPLIESPDISLILGHHAHVVQPFEEFGDKWVVYGMGNQLARHADPIDDNREGVMARITFTETAPKEWKITEAAAIPTWTDISPDIRLVDLPAALANPTLPAKSRAVYQAAYDRISGYLHARGAAGDGLKVLAPTG